MMNTRAAIPITSMKESTLWAAMPIIMPMEPIMSNGLRPNLSTVKMANRVKMMLTNHKTTVCLMETSPEAPRFSNILGA